MISALRHEQMAKVGSRLRLHPELVGVTFPALTIRRTAPRC